MAQTSIVNVEEHGVKQSEIHSADDQRSQSETERIMTDESETIKRSRTKSTLGSKQVKDKSSEHYNLRPRGGVYIPHDGSESASNSGTLDSQEQQGKDETGRRGAIYLFPEVIRYSDEERDETKSGYDHGAYKGLCKGSTKTADSAMHDLEDHGYFRSETHNNKDKEREVIARAVREDERRLFQNIVKDEQSVAKRG